MALPDHENRSEAALSAVRSTPPADMAHGGRLLAVAASFPRAPAPWIDLSTGISPFSFPVRSIPRARFTRLPEPEQEARLRAVAATAYEAPDSRHVAAAPGSQMLISLLPSLLPCRRAAVLVPGYAEHETAWERAGATLIRAGSVELLRAEARDGTVLVLSNPNNPDGRRLGHEAFDSLARHCTACGAWLVVDEAYADLEPGMTQAARWLTDLHRLVVLRSFGKSYGLAGLRLGFLLAAPSLVESAAALMGPWPVSGPAIEIGTRALADAAWRAKATRRVAGAGRRLDRLLTSAGLDASGGTSLFRLVRSPHAARLWRHLAERGLLVRRFASDGDALRFGLPPGEAAWRRLALALASFQSDASGTTEPFGALSPHDAVTAGALSPIE